MKLDQAEQSFRSGDIDRALYLTRELVSANPSFAGAQFLLGRIHSARNELGQAIACFQTSYRLDPSRFEYALEFAISLYNGNRKVESVPVFKKALELQPGNQTVRNYLSLLDRSGSLSGGGSRLSSSYGGRRTPHSSPSRLRAGSPAAAMPPVSGSAGSVHGLSSPVNSPPAPPPVNPGRSGVTVSAASSRSNPGIAPPVPVPDDLERSSITGTAGNRRGHGDRTTDLYAAVHETPAVESRAERLKRLRAADLDDDLEVDFNDPSFWEKYQMYSTTKEVQLSEAEKTGEVHLMSHDFTELHQEDFEREQDEKAALPIFKPGTAWFASHVAWPLGPLYLGRGGLALRRFILQSILLGFIVLFAWLAISPFYTDDFARRLHGIKAYNDMLKEDPEIFVYRREILRQLAIMGLVMFGTVYLLLQRKFANECFMMARDSNLSLGLITDIGQDFKFETNLGSLHGITPRTRMIVEKRSFRAEYDDDTGTQRMVASFARIGRCEILEIFETSCYCAYHPDKGRIVLPKIGDRVTVLTD